MTGRLPVELFLGLRYLRSRGSRTNLSLFVWIGVGGVFLGVAALIVEALASLDAQVTIATDDSAPVSARSPTALMSLGTRAGDVLRIEADGAGAEAAVDRIVAVIRDGFGELAVDRSGAQDAGFDGLSPHPIGVSPGRVVGPALRMPELITEPDPTVRIPEAERPAAIGPQARRRVRARP
mgnify:CR=1 FL=1